MRQWTEQLRYLIQQSFEIFNVYGKEPEQAKSIFQGFVMTLEGVDMADIRSAFKDWMKQSSAMPTPSDIRKLALENARDRTHAQTAKVLALPAKQPAARRAPWAYKMWADFTDEDKRLLAIHLDELGPKAPTYLNYLHHHCGMPKEVNL
jgi:hypothetical protein